MDIQVQLDVLCNLHKVTESAKLATSELQSRKDEENKEINI